MVLQVHCDPNSNWQHMCNRIPYDNNFVINFSHQYMALGEAGTIKILQIPLLAEWLVITPHSRDEFVNYLYFKHIVLKFCISADSCKLGYITGIFIFHGSVIEFECSLHCPVGDDLMALSVVTTNHGHYSKNVLAASITSSLLKEITTCKICRRHKFCLSFNVITT